MIHKKKINMIILACYYSYVNQKLAFDYLVVVVQSGTFISPKTMMVNDRGNTETKRLYTRKCVE